MSTGLGLRCRWPGSCDERFHSNGTVESIGSAASLRDQHEVASHGYHHVQVPMTTWSYTMRFSLRGKTLIGRRKEE